MAPFTALREGICATLKLPIQALKLYIYYYIDIYLKDVFIFGAIMGSAKIAEINYSLKISVLQYYKATLTFTIVGSAKIAKIKCL